MKEQRERFLFEVFEVEFLSLSFLNMYHEENLFDKIATEENAETPDKLVEFLEGADHPALKMNPII